MRRPHPRGGGYIYLVLVAGCGCLAGTKKPGQLAPDPIVAGLRLVWPEAAPLKRLRRFLWRRPCRPRTRPSGVSSSQLTTVPGPTSKKTVSKSSPQPVVSPKPSCAKMKSLPLSPSTVSSPGFCEFSAVSMTPRPRLPMSRSLPLKPILPRGPGRRALGRLPNRYQRWRRSRFSSFSLDETTESLARSGLLSRVVSCPVR